jgi:Rap1a immunity proteins
MKLTTLLILLAVVISPVGSSAIPQTWATGHRVLMDGNALYAVCQKAERAITFSGEHIENSTQVPRDAYITGKCLGYIIAVVDSIPAGEGFDPAENVRLSQYTDVVLRYLRDNPDKRQQPAYYLVRVAITKAFPGR